MADELCVDISNHTDLLIPDALAQWKTSGVGLVIVQAVDPPPPYPPGQTRAQIQACLDAGLSVAAYFWPWLDLTDSMFRDDLRRKMDLLDGLSITEKWADWEDTAAARFPHSYTWDRIRLAHSILDQFPTLHGEPTGVYSAAWWWQSYQYAGDPHFPAQEGRELWDADYDGIADPAQSWQSYGGWAERRIKQFAGTSTLAGIGNVDLDVLSDQEVAELMPQQPDTPTQDPGQDPGWVAKKSLVVSSAGYIAGDLVHGLKLEAARRFGPRRAVVLGYAQRIEAAARGIL